MGKKLKAQRSKRTKQAFKFGSQPLNLGLSPAGDPSELEIRIQSVVFPACSWVWEPFGIFF